MSTSGKWSAAQQAIIQAIDEDVFDTMSLGLLSFPSSTYVNAPACLVNATAGLITTVACGVDVSPAVAMAPAGTLKSNASSGVRHSINQWLQGNSPETADISNATPMYDAMNKGYALLQALPSSIQKRMLVLITDGGGSCTSLSSPTRPGYFDGACNDWEYPATFNTMIAAAQTASTNPVDTFVVGVPGSNSTSQTQGVYATAPYSMLLALSTYAVSGSPTTVDPTCDKTAMFTQTGAAPANPATSTSPATTSTPRPWPPPSPTCAARRSAASTPCRPAGRQDDRPHAGQRHRHAQRHGDHDPEAEQPRGSLHHRRRLLGLRHEPEREPHRPRLHRRGQLGDGRGGHRRRLRDDHGKPLISGQGADSADDEHGTPAVRPATGAPPREGGEQALSTG